MRGADWGGLAHFRTRTLDDQYLENNVIINAPHEVSIFQDR